VCQAWIPTDKRSGLGTRLAPTEGRFVFHSDEKQAAFLELEICDLRLRRSGLTAVEIFSKLGQIVKKI